MTDASEAADVALEPIQDAQIDEVAAFLHRELNPRVSAGQWADGLRGLPGMPPNHGYLLRSAGVVVGANLAFYSSRPGPATTVPVCNLGAFCVLKEYRTHALRLMRALLGQRGYTFTDLSPSGTVPELNRRLGFTDLDTTTFLVPNVPVPAPPGVTVLTDRHRIQEVIAGPARRIFEDHWSAPAALHLLLIEGDHQCYVIARRDRRKNLPLFVTVLHVSNPTLFERRVRTVLSRLGLATRSPLTLLEERVGRCRPAGSIRVTRPRPRMFKSRSMMADDIDYLYSELTQIAW